MCMPAHVQSGHAPSLGKAERLEQLKQRHNSYSEVTELSGSLLPDLVRPPEYAVVFKALSRCQAWRQLLGALQTARPKLGGLRVETYNMAMTACGRSQQWRWILQLFEDLSKEGLYPDVYTFSAAISGCERSGHWALALVLFDEMHERKILPNSFTYSAAVTACERGSQWERALEMTAMMSDGGVEARWYRKQDC
eukprot:TRINITY_DN8178_c0_g3_i1.p1 TRINITY_DN8178_c0_g3~~TRINITY_DN8178_c0_g3_i1.p1  ORF type:complete len:195 (+),score=36.57 TRINITY_DN8178_c0_g3_i1:119-703(+)